MDEKHEDVRLINRGRADHVYGVQNMPCTASRYTSKHDSIATYWVGYLTSTGEEQREFTRLVDQVTGGYRKYRTLDLGAVTSLALDLGPTEARWLTAVDPSQAMLNELVREHSQVARIEPAPFAEVRAERRLSGARFDLVLALGGSASYLSGEDWKELPHYGTGRYILSVYAEGEGPVVEDLARGAREGGREHSGLRDAVRR